MNGGCCQFCGIPFPSGPVVPFWTHECRPSQYLRKYVTYGAAEAPVGLTPPLKACEHCYCITTQVVRFELSGSIPHHQCCNCGNMQRDPVTPEGRAR